VHQVLKKISGRANFPRTQRIRFPILFDPQRSRTYGEQQQMQNGAEAPAKPLSLALPSLSKPEEKNVKKVSDVKEAQKKNETKKVQKKRSGNVIAKSVKRLKRKR